ncbi:NADH dehydrogenase, FAD-containing subunit [Frankineae bacterium MT45]|nr:NADH dehydrogenase, FAD-containing subunit [Frankineae bacterium MT45]
MKIVVIGAGYAGTIAANKAARKIPDAEITVINPRPDFVERVRLHEQLAGTGAAATSLDRMLHESITTVVGTAVRIDDERVLLDGGAAVPFDYLFVAVGSSVTPMPGTVAVGTWEGAEQARTRLTRVPAGGTVTVIGGGLTGIETASELAEARPDLLIRLIAPQVGTSLSEGARRRVHRSLDRLGVEVVEDGVAAVSTKPGAFPGVLKLRSGRELRSDLTLWGILSGIPDLAARSGLTVNAEGRAVVDEYLRSVNNQRIFVVGDCAAVPGARLCCAAATPQGAYAAATLARMVKERRLKKYSMGYVGQAVSLGRGEGLIQASKRDGSLRRWYIGGRAAAWSKESITRYAKFGSRTTVYAWVPGPR